MSTKRFSSLCLGLTCAAMTIAPANADLTNAAGQPAALSSVQAISNFYSTNANSAISRRDNGSIARVYGKAFSHGQTAQISTQSFVDQHASMWGVDKNDLVAEGPFKDGHHIQPIGYLPESDSYKFTGHYYKQYSNGIEVFRSKLVLLTRNEENNPLVLASSELHDLGNFQADPQIMRQAINQDQITEKAMAHYATNDILVWNSSRKVFAGVDTMSHAPTLADVSEIMVDGFAMFLVVTDAATGEILFEESLIHTVDVSGNASAIASEGPAADFCAVEISQPLPYLRVSANGIETISDVNGDFTINDAGTAPVNVTATLHGEWFEVFDFLGSVESTSDSVTPPALASLIFNESNTSENNRAQVNAYIAANEVRDFAVRANPSFPTLMNESFPITVNRTDGFCPGNAWYSPSEESINFCLSSGASTPNTAWTSVVQHEYGHHLVNAGGSGQGQYGEGTGDVMSVIILDNPTLGIGFFGSCGSGLRDADNSFQYPCNTGSHACAPLYSGCVWDTRNELVVTEPDDYTEILNFLAVNSILVHSGSDITPQMTIDWLTLDDDDANIGNGTPHYNEIAAGFGAHNMDAPELTLIDISYPSGQPTMIDANGGTTIDVKFSDLIGTLDPSSPTMFLDSGSGFVAIPMTLVSADEYEATFPAVTCGVDVDYYFTAQTTDGTTQVSPEGAPTSGTFTASSAEVDPVPYYADNFQTNTGWSVSGNASDGQWTRGTPAGLGDRGDPTVDGDGSGLCFLTDNVAGNSDVDGGSTILTSPIISATESSAVSYLRWYDNSFGAAPMADVFVVEISDNGGSTWTNLETVGPTGSQVTGGWIAVQHSLVGITGFTANDQFRIRFTASDTGEGSVVEAGVDGVELHAFICDSPCVADLNGDGTLNFFDVSEFLSLFGAGDNSVDLNGDGTLNFFDVSEYLTLFGAGCP
ncbi:MAG: GC-type dockerin domain-anchored protein [Phycisphaerales bacterium]|nr:GC-type dockerin domain-anchored protein [Phycisphaerales bacterium]